MRLIDADAFWEQFECGKKTLGTIRSVLPEELVDAVIGIYDELKERLDDAPTIDAVKVIRCKNCKYSSDNKVYGCRIESFNYDMNTRMYANDFCSRAERRADETD